jgi:hypothetical protein
MRFPRLRPFVLSCCAASLVACGADATAPAAPTVASVAGVYALRDVGGQPLPAVVQATSSTVRVLSASRTLRADGTCDYTGSYRGEDRIGRLPASDYTLSGTCTWALAGDVVTFRYRSDYVPTGGTGAATVEDGGALAEASTYAPYIGPLRYVR